MVLKVIRIKDRVSQLLVPAEPFFNTLRTRNSSMGTLAKSEHQDEMAHNATFHQGLHCLLKPTKSLETEKQHI